MGESLQGCRIGARCRLRGDRGTETTVITFPSHLVSGKKGRDKGKVKERELSARDL